MDSLLKITQSKIAQYNALIQKAYDLLHDENKQTLLHVLEHCGIPKNVEVIQMYTGMDFKSLTDDNKYMVLYVSKGQLKVCQGIWTQQTGNIASQTRIFKDINAEQHICLILKTVVPKDILRTLYINQKKIIPILSTLYGFEPYNILDMPIDQLASNKVTSTAMAIMYQEKYAKEIDFILHLPPYRAAQAFLILSRKININIQTALHTVLSHGVKLNASNIVIYSFDPIAEATKDLTIKYQADETTPEEKDKIAKYIALYLAEIEKASTASKAYIESLYNTINIKEP